MGRPVRLSEDMIRFLEARRKKLASRDDSGFVSYEDASKDLAEELEHIYGGHKKKKKNW